MTRAREWEPVFLEQLRLHGNATYAAKLAGVDRRTPYARRDRSKTFAEQWADAREESISALALKARSMAMNGDGQMVRWLLSRLAPEEYGDKMALEHSGPGGQPLKSDVTVIIDAIRDPATRDALDNLSKRMEGHASGDGG